MNKKPKAWTDSNGDRHYSCRICGKDVIMSRSKWHKLKPANKRICPDCLYLRGLPAEPSYSPYGPYMFGGF